MSKESYIRGFCKAAEAHGINPVQLAKYAATNETVVANQPIYKTDGYSPVPPIKHLPGITPALGGDIDIPYVAPPTGMAPTTEVFGARNSAPRVLARPSELDRYVGYDKSELALRIANPRHGAWFDAHTNALKKATQPLRDVGFDTEASMDWGAPMSKALKDAISKIYHDEMKRTTSAPPARVSAPTKK